MYDALDHAGGRQDNLIRIGKVPSSVSDVSDVFGDLYIIRNHAYENMVDEQQAKADERLRKNDTHFHNLGAEKYTNAVLSIKHPMAMMYETSENTPVIRAILDENGNNGAPLYAWIRFYANEAINGRYNERPHMVVTIAEREFNGVQNRSGYKELLESAIKENRLLSFDKEKWNLLPVNARTLSTGIVTERFLNQNIAQFKKEVNAFKAKKGNILV